MTFENGRIVWLEGRQVPSPGPYWELLSIGHIPPELRAAEEYQHRHARLVQEAKRDTFAPDPEWLHRLNVLAPNIPMTGYNNEARAALPRSSLWRAIMRYTQKPMDRARLRKLLDGVYKWRPDEHEAATRWMEER